MAVSNVIPPATDVTFDPAGTGLVSTNVQAAVVEASGQATLMFGCVQAVPAGLVFTVPDGRDNIVFHSLQVDGTLVIDGSISFIN